jgi:hypothetical protein
LAGAGERAAITSGSSIDEDNVADPNENDGRFELEF